MTDDKGGTGGKKKVDPHAPLKRGLEGLAKLKETLAAQETETTKAVQAREAEAKRRAEVHAREKAAKAEGWKPDRDREILAVAMSGVTPLGDRGRTARGGPAGARNPARGGRGDAGAAIRRAHAEGTEGLTVRWDANGGCAAARQGREFALEALGRFAAPQDTLDVHGCDVEEARHRVAEFVRTRRARGLRTVCVVHGVGKHALDGTTVLRDAAVKALSEGIGAREVDAFRTAETGVGGAGTLMISLRMVGKK